MPKPPFAPNLTHAGATENSGLVPKGNYGSSPVLRPPSYRSAIRFAAGCRVLCGREPAQRRSVRILEITA